MKGLSKIGLLAMIVLGIVNGVNAQPFADGGIFISGTTLSIKFKPSADITGGFTAGNFGIRWLSSLGSTVDLSSEVSSFGYLREGPKSTSGSFDYVVYAAVSSIGSTTYNAGVEYTLLTATLPSEAIGGTFELCPGGFAGDAGVWYIEIGGADRANTNAANWYYNASDDYPLPVELTSFTATARERNIELKWATATEVNSSKFEIERGDGKEWKKVGEKEASGNSNVPKEYSSLDKIKVANGGKLSYRLKMIDADGKFNYSKEAEVVVVPTVYALEQNYPNPFNPTTKIQYALPEDARVSLKVYDIVGREVASIVNEEQKAGYYEQNFGGYSFASGVYLYRIITESKGKVTFSKVKKMLMIK